jgi:hypothetical protein
VLLLPLLIILTGLFFLLEQADSAIVALNCSGMLLGTQPIRFDTIAGGIIVFVTIVSIQLEYE